MITERRSALRSMLLDPDADVRQAAATALDVVEAVADFDRLLSVLRNGERVERLEAVYALGKLNHKRVYPALLEALKADDAEMRLLAVKVLGEKKHPKTVAALIKLLDDPELAVQVEVARVLGGFGDPALLAVLGPLVCRQEELALVALDAIGELNSADGEQVVFTAIRDKRSAVRAKAAQILACLPL
ncbi:HEAT repeat-containing protein [Malonomonas rubra DSM 5091]|uniref:HEAT repeat-containing protein n=1 Tax=Malonomonas rubra DSM 5091 TaxID=1122189 RepID=A0A1M6I916_MALRU|nr:HEAT repeat domain-containing protein [Malonomonas rubra]SHJ30866.1 HEAT repeat-containing protein [Malonomonas rubra DSM 5091]